MSTANVSDYVIVGYSHLMIEVFVQTLMSLASKSFSHSFAAISKLVDGIFRLGLLRIIFECVNEFQTMIYEICNMQQYFISFKSIAFWMTFEVKMFRLLLRNLDNVTIDLEMFRVILSK